MAAVHYTTAADMQYTTAADADINIVQDYTTGTESVVFEREIYGRRFRRQFTSPNHIHGYHERNAILEHQARIFEHECAAAMATAATTATYTTATASEVRWVEPVHEKTWHVETAPQVTWHSHPYLDSEWEDISHHYPANATITSELVDFYYNPAPMTHSQKMQAKIDKEWWAHCENERIEMADKAEVKALELLETLIGPEEIEVYKNTGRIFVKGKNGIYLAKKDGGISRIEGNKIIDFCIHIERKYDCPPTDHAIALKLMLEQDDRNVIRIANRMNTRTVDQLPLAACM